MTRAAGHLVERVARTRVRLEAEIARALGQFLETRVTAVRLNVELEDVLRIVGQSGIDRVDAEQQFAAGAHLRFFPFALVALSCATTGNSRDAAADLSGTRRKSILRSSMLARSTCTRTASPRRNCRPRRSPLSKWRTGSK